MKKRVFVDGHKRKYVFKDCQKFLKIMENHTTYIIDFQADGFIEKKDYPSDCTVNGPDQRPLIVITNDKSIFWQKLVDSKLGSITMMLSSILKAREKVL